MDHLQNVMGYFDQQQPLCAEHDRISKDLYKEFGVKAGLRDENGKGVLAGLTNISDIRASAFSTMHSMPRASAAFLALSASAVCSAASRTAAPATAKPCCCKMRTATAHSLLPSICTRTLS